jgi:hypothetical protein
MTAAHRESGPAALSAAPLRVEPVSLDDLETPAAVVDPGSCSPTRAARPTTRSSTASPGARTRRAQEPRGRPHPARERRARAHRRDPARSRGHGGSDRRPPARVSAGGRSKVARVLDLPASVDLLIGLDSEPALEALAARRRRRRTIVGVLVEVDVGMHRVGVQTPEEARALAARRVSSTACATAA